MWHLESWRRSTPRVLSNSFCTEIADDEERHALAVDFSPGGVRIQRPLIGDLPEVVQLEFEIPTVDELIWAAFAVRFDSQQMDIDGLRTTGLEMIRAPDRHRRFLRDYVYDAYWANNENDLFRSACYRNN